MTDLVGQVGDSLSVPSRVSDVEGGVARPRMLGGATLTARVRFGASPRSKVAPDNLRAVVEDATNGIVRVTLPKDHLLPAATYHYEVDLAQGTSNETIMAGRLTINPTLI